ncbi:MAG: hypothetical protein QF510_10055, partial [Rhodospirillales bacterium]|nr:hypothetical protein [Rhodospirillales bacterium]
MTTLRAPERRSRRELLGSAAVAVVAGHIRGEADQRVPSWAASACLVGGLGLGRGGGLGRGVRGGNGLGCGRRHGGGGGRLGWRNGGGDVGGG